MNDFKTPNDSDISNDQQAQYGQQYNNGEQNQQYNNGEQQNQQYSEFNPQQGQPYTQPNWQQRQTYGGYKQKSKIAAGLFGIFLGALGVHNFYLGYTGKAVAQLLITLLTCGFGSFISGIWGLIEGILILTGEISMDAQGVILKELFFI